MMINKTSLYAAALLVSTTCCFSNSFAKDSGVYLGVNAGKSHIDVGDVSQGFASVPTTFSKNESGTALAFALGYRFNPFIALEGAYADYGKATVTADHGFTIANATFTNIDANVAMKGSVAALVLSVPAGNWEFSTRLGAYFANTKISVHVRYLESGGGFSPSVIFDRTQDISASSTETLATLGVGYTVADHYHLKLEWTRIPKVGDKEKTGEGDVTALTLGFQYRF
jgi:hypothetical protein